jgi:hypothetical protein
MVKINLSLEDEAACERDLLLYGNYFVTVGRFADGERGRRIAPQDVSVAMAKHGPKRE